MAMTDPLSRQAAETDTIPAPTSTPPASAEPEEPDPLEVFLAKFKDGRPSPPQELLTVIRDDAGLDIEDMDEIPMMDRVDYGGVKWIALQSPPGGAMNDYYIAMIFIGDQYDPMEDHLAGDARVYVAPRVQKNDAGEPMGYFRYTINRAPGGGGGTTRAVMRLKRFVEELSDELEQMAVAFDVLSEDDEAEE